MNTIHDLQSELDRLADESPAESEVRQTLTERVAAQGKRRRTTALIAVAASVVLVVGGASITSSVLSHRSTGPAAPSPVVQVPEVPLPAGTQLIRHALQPVRTPVTATPPGGLTGQTWMSAPGRLAVSWFDPSAEPDGMLGSTSAPSRAGELATGLPRAAGYVVTDSRDDGLTSFGAGGPAPVTVSHRDTTIDGRAVSVDIAPADTTDQFGFPADERLSWQLSDGRWIHVWTTFRDGGSSVSPELAAFAKTITEVPQTLDRTVGIGLTLPSLSVDSTVNSSPLASMAGGAMVFLCPIGVDPLQPSYSSSSGSGSSGPDGTTSTEAESSQDPTADCLTAGVVNYPQNLRASMTAGREIAVGEAVAHVDVEQASAWAELPGGLLAVVRAPTSAHVSAVDLAALAVSVRLSPAVTVLPPSAPQAPKGSVNGTSMPQPGAMGQSSAVASSSAAPESSAATPVAVVPAAGLVKTSNIRDDNRTVTLKFSFQNITDSAVPLRGLTATVAGFTQVGAYPAQATKIGPRQNLDVWLEFKVGQCSEVDPATADPQIEFQSQVDGTWWDGSIMSPVDGWVRDAVTHFCP